MPEGITREQLDAKRLQTIEACLNNGYNFTDRLHIIAWGNKRGEFKTSLDIADCKSLPPNNQPTYFLVPEFVRTENQRVQYIRRDD